MIWLHRLELILSHVKNAGSRAWLKERVSYREHTVSWVTRESRSFHDTGNPKVLAAGDSRTAYEKKGKKLSRWKLGVLAVFATVCSSVAFVWAEVESLKKGLKLTTDIYDIEKKSTFIYLRNRDNGKDGGKEAGKKKSLKKKIKDKVNKKAELLLPWFQAHSHDPWVLLNLAQSKDSDMRKLGLEALVKDHNWDDHHYTNIAQSADERTLVSLARMEEADSRFFRKMPKLHPPRNCIEDEFRILLSSLPKDGVEKCLEHFTSQALLEGNIEEERGGLWCFGGMGLEYAKSLSPVPEETVEVFCLEALVKHSAVAGHCRKMVDLGALPLLQRVYQKRRKSIVIRRLIAWVIANLSLNPELHHQIVSGGWVTALHHWIRSKDTALCMHATRALANLDRDWDFKGHYEDGIYLVHPAFRQKDAPTVDVVFVHGLMGGPFKTWRQQDRRIQSDNTRVPIDENFRKNYTFCWPKDWLAKDCPGIRVLTVGYDTELSQWNTKCPYETEKRSIEMRSKALMHKLHRADVGSRPTIWVGHSMGGLLIKELLSRAESNKEFRSMARNTIGVIFYSTPHRGSQLAKYSNQASYLVFPSIEVQELNKDNLMLRTLHKNFLQVLADHSIRCLSFGEQEKLAIGMKLKVLIVPPESSDPGVGEFHAMPMNHLNICKPWDENSELYQLTLQFVQRCIFHSNIESLIKLGRTIQESSK